MRIRRLVILIVVARVLSGQPDDKPAADWIRSGEPLKQAWAAHWIAEQHTESLVPDMLKVLADRLPMTTGDPADVTDAEAARLAILDALIQLHEPAPLADLAALIQKFPTEVLIVAASSHEDNGALLLQLLDRPHNYEAFIAIGNLLTPRRDLGFALNALQEFSVHDEIMVFSPGQDQNIGSGWAGDSFAKKDPERAGWPETGTYVLTIANPPPPVQRPARIDDPSAPPPRPEIPPTATRRPAPPRDDLIADGRYKVSARRQVGRTYADHGFHDHGSGSGRTIPDRAQEFLADYLDMDAAQLPVHAAEALKITWAGDADFRDRVRQFFAGQRLRYTSLLQMLIARKYLSVEGASKLQLQILPWVDDERNMGRTELPDVRPLTGNQGPSWTPWSARPQRTLMAPHIRSPEEDRPNPLP